MKPPRRCPVRSRLFRVFLAPALPGLLIALGLAACAGPFSRRVDQSRATGVRVAESAWPADEFAVGADLSFLGAAEAEGTEFRADGVVKPGLQIFRERGYAWVRLRLFHTPSNERRPLPNDLAYTLEQARRAKALGFKLLLVFHYSDTWADPAHQTTPAAWRELGPEALAEAVRSYTRETIAAFREAGVLPDMVQPGNEVTAGMLWPHGKLPENWDNFLALTRAGIAGVREGAGAGGGDGAEARGAGAMPLILVQIERSGDPAATKWFLDRLLAAGIEPDVLGQSYYPWWHGSLEDLRTTLHAMARDYGRPVMVVETAYCWRPTEYRAEKLAGPTPPKGPAPFPESPEGQRDFLAAVAEVVRGVPDGLGAGVFWWEPAVGAGRGRGGLRDRGMFDDAGEALPVLEVFAR